MEDFYGEALKLGQKEYRKCVSAGGYPFLPALDDMIPEQKMLNTSSLGIVQIPIEHIVGTKTNGRTTTFAANFMPLADDDSEFAIKWKSLCRSHLNEGIRDPITAYEYMNRFYVSEGNKRVSVLKFFGSPTIEAKVIRIIPERNQSREYESYLKFLEFYDITKVFFIEFSRPGSYKELLRLLSLEQKEDWNIEERRNLSAAYYNFKTIFDKLGGKDLRITASDAMLAFIRIYGFEILDKAVTGDIREKLENSWQEILLLQEENPIDIVEDPSEKGGGLLSKILPKPKVRAAFLYRLQPQNSDWIMGHEEGRVEVQRRLDAHLETKTYYCIGDEETERAISKAIEEGAKVIFATSAQMMKACQKMAVEHPDVAILNCSLNVSSKTVRTYYPRIYEAKYVSGAIAGAMCENNMIGYICKYPVFGSVAEINAFARGVQLTNAHARVYLEWMDDYSLAVKAGELFDRGIRIMSVRDHMRSVGDERLFYGLQEFDSEGRATTLAAPVWKWEDYYEKIIRSIMDGTYKVQGEKNQKSLNYFWGMKSGVVDIKLSEKLPSAIHYLGELMVKAIGMGACRPFFSPEQGEDGRINWENVRASATMEEIVNIDRLEPNIVGRIPEYEELSDKARDLVDVMGIKSLRKDLQ